jgi:ABC-type Zn uptake system ZnuABC Zn-binding protein ZnuA
MKYALAIVAAIILVNCKTKKETTKEAPKEAPKPVVVKFKRISSGSKNVANCYISRIKRRKYHLP